jgi:hypothetical protein
VQVSAELSVKNVVLFGVMYPSPWRTVISAEIYSLELTC